jgi:single-strand DNA-binding protein
VADVNKVILIGRLTRDPESRTFSNGGRVAHFGFAVGSRRFNQQTNQWEDGDTMFIDCEAFNRGEFGKLADRVEQYLRKGTQVYLEGRLKLDQWDDKQSGQKRSKHKLVVENMQMFGPRTEDGTGRGPSRASAPADSYNESFGEPEPAPGGGGGGANEDIPF